MEEISPGLENVYIKYTELTFIDGQKGIMRYRGYDINELAEKSSFEKVSYLMLFGKFPDDSELKNFKNKINSHLALDDYLKDILRAMPETSDSLGILQTLLSAKASRESNYKYTKENDGEKIPEILGSVLSMVANIYRLKSGNNIIDPEPGESYAETFLKACSGSADKNKISAMDSALILYMDHEIPASTTAALVTASTLSDMYSSLVKTPGHTRDSTSYYLKEQKVVFSGDAAVNLKGVPGYNKGFAANPENAEKSLKAIRTMDALILPGHGDKMDLRTGI